MSDIDDQDLADKALAKEFAGYLGSVAKEFVKPVQSAAEDAQRKIIAATADAASGIKKASEAAYGQIMTSAKSAGVEIGESANRNAGQIEVSGTRTEQLLSSAASRAASSIAASVDSHTHIFGTASNDLLSQLSDLGRDITSIVASISEGHEATRTRLIELLDRNKQLADHDAQQLITKTVGMLQVALTQKLSELIAPLVAFQKVSSERTADIVSTSEERIVAEVKTAAAEQLQELGQIIRDASQHIFVSTTTTAETQLSATRLALVSDIEKIIQTLTADIDSRLDGIEQRTSGKLRHLAIFVYSLVVISGAALVVGVVCFVR